MLELHLLALFLIFAGLGQFANALHILPSKQSWQIKTSPLPAMAYKAPQLCMHEGKLYFAGQLITQSSYPYCQRVYCRYNGEIISWKDIKCINGNSHIEPTPSSHPPTPSTAISTGCWYHGRYYSAGEEVDNYRYWYESCSGRRCNGNGRIVSFGSRYCPPQSSKIQPTPSSNPPMTSSAISTGCWYNGRYYSAGEEVNRYMSWYGRCSGKRCEGNGRIVSFGPRYCPPQSSKIQPTPSSHQPTPSRAISTGCWYHGRYYSAGEEVDNYRSWYGSCSGRRCNGNGRIVSFGPRYCPPQSSKIQPTPSSHPPMTSSAISTGCWSNGRYYSAGEEVDNYRSWYGRCSGKRCEGNGRIVSFGPRYCPPQSSKIQPTPSSNPPMISRST